MFSSFMLQETNGLRYRNQNQTDKSMICIYDSLYQKPSSDIIRTMARYCHWPEKQQLILKVMNVDRQPNSNDYGMYAMQCHFWLERTAQS